MKLSSTHTRPRSRAIFFVPAAYFIATRLKDMPALISWILIYPVPLVLSALAVSDSLPGAAGLVSLLLAMLATYTLYELGYMDNDTRTVLWEVEPTERLSVGEKAFYGRWKWIIASVRLVMTVCACLAVEWLINSNEPGKRIFFTGLLLILVVFPVYNSTRGPANLPLHLVLVSCRFCLPGMVLVSTGRWDYFLMMMFAFPVINLLERCGESRYGLSALEPILEFRNRYRALYYLFGLLVAAFLWIAGMANIGAVVIFAYFSLYRLLAPGILPLLSARR